MQPGDYGKRVELEIEDSRVLRALQDRAKQSVQIETVKEDSRLIEGGTS